MENYEQVGLLQDQFSRQAKNTPEKVAVVCGDGRTLTYRELDEQTDLVADFLRHKGVGPEKHVGIYMERCLEYTISYIAILKAGGAYIPMDVSYPIPLIDDILQDAKPITIFVKADMQQYLPGTQHVTVMDVGWQERIRKETAQSPPPPVSPYCTLDSLAYTVYSSGTTGKPKGIQCPQRGAVFSYYWRTKLYPYREDDKEACNVFFVWEMLRPLLKGITMYIIPDNTIYDPNQLCSFIEKKGITRMLFTPSLLEAVLDTMKDSAAQYLSSMREILFCGEVVTTSLLERCVTLLPWIQFINLYSVSETHDVAMADLSVWYHKNKVKWIKSKSTHH